MSKPTEAELRQQLADLQAKYEKDLDQVFTDLHSELDALEPELTPAPAKGPETPPKPPEPPPMPPQGPPKSVATPPEESPQKAPEGPEKDDILDRPKGWVPRWRDTWRYHGLKGLAARVFRGTNPDLDTLSWKYGENKRLSLQQYLKLHEFVGESVDSYFVLEEAVHPKIVQAYEKAKQKIKQLLRQYLMDAHKLGVDLGRLLQSDEFLHPKKQKDLFDKGEPEVKPPAADAPTPLFNPPSSTTPPPPVIPPKKKEPEPEEDKPIVPPEDEAEKLRKKQEEEESKKREQAALAAHREKRKKEIMEGAFVSEARYKELVRFEPWSWFTWASKPTANWVKANQDKVTAESTPDEVLDLQWQSQAGRKFTQDQQGLENLFLAFRNGWFGETNYHQDGAVCKAVAMLFEKMEKVQGQPWKTFVTQYFQGHDDSAEDYLAQLTLKRKIPNRADLVKKEEPKTERQPQQAPEEAIPLPPDALASYGEY